jgi:F-type H+-transporting ATPase subunit a
MDPIHQFEISKYFVFARFGNIELAFTESAIFMLLAVALIALLMIGATSRRALIPGRPQALAEMSYEFVASMLQTAAGPDAMEFFPLVFSLFMFVLFGNMVALIPYSFAVTAQIIITVSLALTVFLTVIVYGVWHNGLNFFKLFVPSGAPVLVLPLLVPIEVLSFFTRPVSHSLRLFANILAGHIALKVFAGFVTMLGAFGFLGWLGAVLPFGMTVALFALELLVAFLQAYVFAILTCIYLKDAIHPGH